MNQSRGRFAIALGKHPEPSVDTNYTVNWDKVQKEYEEEISKRAFRIYQDRIADGLPGTAESDWHRAEMEYKAAPIRIVWAEGLNDEETDRLREQVDLALADPNYSIICNYAVNWVTIHPRPNCHPIVWAEGLNDEGVDNLRQQVDSALLDPNFTIVTNYAVHWEEHE